MTVFLIGNALLVMTALAFLLPPLLRKEQTAGAHLQRDELNLAVLRDQLRELDSDLEAGVIDQLSYEGARQELERRVAQEVQPSPALTRAGVGGRRWDAMAVGMLVPVLAIAIYVAIGTPVALDPAQRVAANDNRHEVTPEQIERMVVALAQRLQNEPDNVEGWGMLARSYNALGRHSDATQAYAHLVKLLPNDAGLLADYADTLAMANNRSLQGEPEKVIERAIAADEKNVKALALWGSAAFERKDFAKAVVRWQKILVVVPADSDIARAVSRNIGEAQSLMGQSP